MDEQDAAGAWSFKANYLYDDDGGATSKTLGLLTSTIIRDVEGRIGIVMLPLATPGIFTAAIRPWRNWRSRPQPSPISRSTWC